MTRAAPMLARHILTMNAVTARIAAVISKGVCSIMALVLQPRRCRLYPAPSSIIPDDHAALYQYVILEH